MSIDMGMSEMVLIVDITIKYTKHGIFSMYSPLLMPPLALMPAILTVHATDGCPVVCSRGVVKGDASIVEARARWCRLQPTATNFRDADVVVCRVAHSGSENS